MRPRAEGALSLRSSGSVRLERDSPRARMGLRSYGERSVGRVTGMHNVTKSPPDADFGQISIPQTLICTMHAPGSGFVTLCMPALPTAGDPELPGCGGGTRAA